MAHPLPNTAPGLELRGRLLFGHVGRDDLRLARHHRVHLAHLHRTLRPEALVHRHARPAAHALAQCAPRRPCLLYTSPSPRDAHES
eukprot:1503933-Prymnesium_polylepis.1